MTDYYEVLRVSKDASDDDIKRAYRKLARECHPDKGGDKEHFQRIQEAYEVLSDKDKRAEYDNPHTNNINTVPFPFDLGGLFGGMNMNTQRGPCKLSNHMYTCKIPLDDAYTGVHKKFRVKRTRLCVSCNTDCNLCRGTGTETKQMQNGPFIQIMHQQCHKCSGKGKCQEVRSCSACQSKGSIHEEKVIELEIQKGVESGKQFVIPEWGEQATKANDISGDLIVNLVIDDHPHFKRQGLDLIYNINVSLKESIIGKKVNIPHFSGNIELDTRGFGVINPNKQYTVFDKGLEDATNKKGNLHLRFEVSYPGTLTSEQIHALKNAFDACGL